MSLGNSLDPAFFNLDLFFCAISRANEWARTFICSFIYTSVAALILALQKMLLKAAFIYEKFFNSQKYHQLLFFF